MHRYSQTEHVGFAIVLLVVKHFGCYVARSAASSEQKFKVLLEGSKPKVYQHRQSEVVFRRIDYIFWLHVSVNDVFVFEIRQGLWSKLMYLEHSSSHIVYCFAINFSLFVVDNRTQTFSRIEFAQAVDVVIPFVDF